MGHKSSDIEGQLASTLRTMEASKPTETGKSASELPVESRVDSPIPSATEFPRNEMSNESQSATSEDSAKDQESEKGQPAEWNDIICFQLAEILANNLMEACQSALKKVTECGYTAEVSEWAILNSGVFYGNKDTASNLAEGALALLKRDQELKTPKHSVFDGFQKLVEYTLLEMIHVVQEVRPGVKVYEAMWSLMISDLNLVSVCVAPNEIAKVADSKSGISSACQSDSNKKDGSDVEQSKIIADAESSPKPLNSETQPIDLASTKVEKEKSIALQEEKEQTSGVHHEKSGASSKKGANNHRRDVLRQKAMQLDKSFKGRMSKGAFKAKVTAWGNMVMDRTISLQQSLSSNVLAPGSFSKPSNSEKVSPSSNKDKDNPSSDSKPGVEGAAISSEKNSTVASRTPSISSESSAASSVMERHFPEIKSDMFSSFRSIDYLFNIPYDENLRRFVPQNENDEAILILIPYKHVLKQKIKSWSTWANEKVMEVAKRLGKDKAEMRMLKQEKEDLEKLKRDQQNSKENNLKRLVELGHALANMTKQIQISQSTMHRLEGDNASLKGRLEAAKKLALESSVRLEESLVREQEAARKLQLKEAEKAFLLKQSNDLKSVDAGLGKRLEKAKAKEDRFEALLKKEEKETEAAMAQIESLKQKRESDETLAREAENRIKQMAEADTLKCAEEIKNLEAMIAKMRHESERSKIAALSMGYGNNKQTAEEKSASSGLMLHRPTKRLAVFQGNFGGSAREERECVMCMTKEISVVFLPCAHQVLCTECNVRHEKEGMVDCPSCRTAIHKRISVRYR